MPERIVIYRLGSLGDTIITLPCLHKIAEVFPRAERYVLTNKPVSSKAAPLEAILKDSGLIDRVIDYPVHLRSPGQLAALASRLRALKSKTLIYMTPSRGTLAVYRDVLFFRLCGFTKIIGAPLTKDLQQNRVDPVTGFVERESERLARTLASLGPIDLNQAANWDLHLQPSEIAKAQALLSSLQGRPFIALNMGGKVVVNHWGKENWHGLLQDLATTYGSFALVVVGAAEDRQEADEVTRDWPAPVINACGSLSPRESAAALRQASLFIGHDSGPLHLASSVGTTCIGLFSGLNKPKKWHPLDPRHTIIHHMQGIETIEIGEVAAAVRASLHIARNPEKAFQN